MTPRKLITALFLLTVFVTFPQHKKTLNIVRTDAPPKIDGVLDDTAWMAAAAATDFVQFRPEMGVVEKDHQRSLVKMVYDDKAIYISAYLHDSPETMRRQFTSRDNFGQSDFFGVVFNTNNDGQNDLEFFVQSSGTQADAIASPDIGEDFGWNAVWESSVKIVNDGWIVEMKIPYSALRFTNQDNPTWGLQFHRHFRIDRTQYAWSPIDVSLGYHALYHGELKGLTPHPPQLLSVYLLVAHLVRW